MIYFLAKNKFKILLGLVAVLLIAGLITAVIFLKPAPAPEPEPDKITTISVEINTATESVTEGNE